MSTRSRIGILLPDDSILSVYHHWDGYPEWLGVTLEEHYNTYEKASELIDGGNMSSCYSDNEYDDETQEFVKRDPRPEYYGGDDEAPILSKNFDEFTRIDCWQEYSYVFVKDRWVAYSINQKFDKDYNNITKVIVKEVEIPKKQTVE
jgi:hypothetical protein